jgi:hypothetical protein
MSLITDLEGDAGKAEADLSGLNELVSTGEADVKDVVLDHATIITEAHSFFDFAKSKIESIAADVIASAKSAEEAVESLILSAFGHASENAATVSTGEEIASS